MRSICFLDFLTNAHQRRTPISASCESFLGRCSYIGCFLGRESFVFGLRESEDHLSKLANHVGRFMFA